MAAIIAGCASQAVNLQSSQVAADNEGLRAFASQREGKFEELDAVAYNHYVNGLLYEGIGDLKSAAESFRLAFQYYPESCELGAAYAGVLYRMGQPQTALKAIKNICSDDPEILSFKAMLYRRTGAHNQARDTYLQLIRIDPNREESYIYLAGFYERENKLDSTVWALKELARIRTDSHEVLNELGRVLRFQRDLDGAKEAFRQSLEVDKSLANMPAMVFLSELYESAGQIDSAAAVFEQALHSNPQSAQLHREIARIWMEQDSTRPALPHLRAVADLDPQDFRTQRQLALAYFDLDSLDVADSVLTSLVENGPSEPGNHYFLGQIALRKKQFQRAQHEFKTVTELAASQPDGWMGLAWAYRQMGQDDEEIRTYQDGLLHMSEEKNAIKLYFSLGTAFERTGQVDSAVVVFEEILKHDPDHAASLNYLGYTLADRNMRLPYARDLIARAVELEPNNAAFLDSYGWVYFRLGKLDSALFYLSQAAQLDSDPVIYDHLGDAYAEKGDLKQAREWWQKALDRQPDNEELKQKLLQQEEPDEGQPAQR